MSEPRYKWDHPADWFEEFVETKNAEDVRFLAKLLASRLDSDTLQDLFQNDMDADGYFKPLKGT